MTGDRPTTPGWHCHRCRSTSCRQRADSDTDHVGRVEYRPLLLTQPSSVSWLWSHTHWCPSQRPQEVMRVDGSANPTICLKTQPSTRLFTLYRRRDRESGSSQLTRGLSGEGVAPRNARQPVTHCFKQSPHSISTYISLLYLLAGRYRFFFWCTCVSASARQSRAQ